MFITMNDIEPGQILFLSQSGWEALRTDQWLTYRSAIMKNGHVGTREDGTKYSKDLTTPLLVLKKPVINHKDRLIEIRFLIGETDCCLILMTPDHADLENKLASRTYNNYFCLASEVI